MIGRPIGLRRRWPSSPCSSSPSPQLSQSRYACVRNFSSTRTRSTEVRPPSDAARRSTGYLYFSSVFPIQITRYDLRHWLAELESMSGVDKVESLMGQVIKQVQGDRHRDSAGDGQSDAVVPEVVVDDIRVEEIVARKKDGGVLVQLSAAASEEGEHVLFKRIEATAREVLKTRSERSWVIPSLGFYEATNRAHLVRGTPFLEDLNRYPNRTLRVEFEGPELSIEKLYELFRPFGKIDDILPQPSSSKDLPRFSTIIYTSIRSATSAKHCLHASWIDSNTLLHILYADRVRSTYIRDWTTSHPRVVIPIIIALLTASSLMIFDPIRQVLIENKVHGGAGSWIRWLKQETLGTLGRFGFRSSVVADTGIERDREDARMKILNWLRDAPDTFIVVSGAKGSGKEALIKEALHDRPNVLTIDLGQISKEANGVDVKLVSAIASAVGYFPQFAILSSLNGLIDLASMGLIGQKAGFSSDTASQLKQILEVTTSALKSIADAARAEQARAADLLEHHRATAEDREEFIERATSYGIRDGRLDSIAGNGIMSELGFGIEKSNHVTIVGPSSSSRARQYSNSSGCGVPTAAVDGLPIVVIKDFALRGETKLDVLNEALAEWAASLIESATAHVIFTTNSATAAAKPLIRSLPTRAFNSINLKDADLDSSFTFITSKLSLSDQTIPSESKEVLKRLGGRRTDLELLITKVRSGQGVEEAVGEIIERAVAEIRKTYFGEEIKLWTRTQAWIILKGLANHAELKYPDVLYNLFKGDEQAIKSLEASDLIIISHKNGQPASILPSTAVFLSAFQLLANDPIFSSSLDFEYGETLIAKAESEIALASKELINLSQLLSNNATTNGERWWIFGGEMSEIRTRIKVLLARMKEAEDRLEKLEKQKVKLKLVFKEDV